MIEGARFADDLLGTDGRVSAITLVATRSGNRASGSSPRRTGGTAGYRSTSHIHVWLLIIPPRVGCRGQGSAQRSTADQRGLGVFVRGQSRSRHLAVSLAATMDFPTSRAIITKLPGWVDKLAGELPEPIKVYEPRGFKWRHPEETARVVLVAKAVRMASGIAAALQLADRRFTVECGALLRTVSDFATEVIFLGEGMLKGEMTTAQSKFVHDFFKPMSTTPDDLARRERDGYVGRKDMHKAHRRLVDERANPGKSS